MPQISVAPQVDWAAGTGTAHNATVTAVPITVAEPGHSGGSNMQWAHNSMHREKALTPRVRRVSKKPAVLIDADEEELLLLGVL